MRIWRDVDSGHRGEASFDDLGLLLAATGQEKGADELEATQARIQKWQASRLLFQGFTKALGGDGAAAISGILGEDEVRAAPGHCSR